MNLTIENQTNLKSKFIWVILAIIIIPSVFSIYSGNLTIANQYFFLWIFILLFFFLARAIVEKKLEFRIISIIIGLSPLINFLRLQEGLFYNIILVVFIVILLLLILFENKIVFSLIKKNYSILFFLIFWLSYYVISLINTGVYYTNLRSLELALAFIITILVGKIGFSYIRLIFITMAISSIFLSISLFSYWDFYSIERLGQLSNPSAIGLSLTIVFIALLVNKSKWLGIENNEALRYFLIAIVFLLSVFNASRMSWLIIIICLFTYIIHTNITAEKKEVLTISIVLVVIVYGLLNIFKVPSVNYWIYRTFNFNSTLSTISSGRTEQWQVALFYISQDPMTIISGNGIGISEGSFYEEISEVANNYFNNKLRTAGRYINWHSLYISLLMSGGLLFLLPYLIWLIKLLSSTIRIRDDSIFFMMIVAYMISIGTVSGWDLLSGFMLGVAYLGKIDGNRLHRL